jgi:regulator of protease activity HflC (stomatin/prohibitin superfamily)
MTNQIQQFFEYIFNAVKIWVIVQPWQTGIRVRFGKRIKKLEKGVYLRIPYFDAIFIQEKRLRITTMPIQTLTSSDQKTITMSGAVGYVISDIEELYQTLYHPETTINNIALSEVAGFIHSRQLEDITPELIESSVLKKLQEHSYGLVFKYFKITNYAIVRTYRLIQDHTWVDEGLTMDE